MTTTVFVYGTLTDAERARSVLRSVDFRGPATLEGLHRVAGEYPTLAPGGRVSGRLLATTDRDALDRYEGVERGLYVPVRVPLSDAESTCLTYVGDPDRLDVGDAVDWPGDGAFAERVRAYAEAEAVCVRQE